MPPDVEQSLPVTAACVKSAWPRAWGAGDGADVHSHCDASLCCRGYRAHSCIPASVGR